MGRCYVHTFVLCLRYLFFQCQLVVCNLQLIRLLGKHLFDLAQLLFQQMDRRA